MLRMTYIQYSQVTSHLQWTRVPQKCTMYSMLTLGNGQHPYPPLGNGQQVALSEHEDFPHGHSFPTLTDFSLAGIFSRHGTVIRPGMHVLSLVSQV